MINPEMVTGEVEVKADKIEILSKCAPLPFQIDDGNEPREDLRLKYRLHKAREALELVARGRRIRVAPGADQAADHARLLTAGEELDAGPCQAVVHGVEQTELLRLRSVPSVQRNNFV